MSHFVCKTNCTSKKMLFTWKIYDYHVSPLKKMSSLHSDYFEFENARFHLEAQYAKLTCRTSSGVGPGNYLTVYLSADSSSFKTDYTYFISLRNKNNESKYQKQGFFNRTDQYPIGVLFVSETEVSESTGLLVNDCLTLYCEVMSLQTTHESNLLPAQGTCLWSDGLSRDLWQLFSSKEKADYVLRVEGQDIPFHSVILSARSSVFAAMLRNDFKENRTKVINVTDIGLLVMNCVLEYSYTGKVQKLKDLSSDSLVELYNAAEKYDLIELKNACSHTMQAQLSQANVEKYATVALTHDDQKLMEAVMALFGSIKDLMDSDLMRELAKKIPNFPMQIWKFVAKRS